MTRRIAGFFKLLIAVQFVIVAAQAKAGNHSRGVQVDNADVIKTDIDASNGVILVIDTVILQGS